ncbi:MAG: hypothetical protein GY820_28735 [Gammaproteobacteria bacterium]|nr:hypothetical protein [Gammaproteobacteria bacterium]
MQYNFDAVIAIDTDPIRLKCALRNAQIYGVSHRIQFILGDFFAVGPSLKGDAVFLSPPWGGPAYSHLEKFDLTQHMDPYSSSFLNFFIFLSSVFGTPSQKRFLYINFVEVLPVKHPSFAPYDWAIVRTFHSNWSIAARMGNLWPSSTQSPYV